MNDFYCVCIYLYIHVVFGIRYIISYFYMLVFV